MARTGGRPNHHTMHFHWARLIEALYCAEVIKALEGFEFDGMGNGPTTYRAEDHQCFKDVYVVRGKEKPANPFDLLEVVATASKDSVTYDPAIFGGELGPDTAVAC